MSEVADRIKLERDSVRKHGVFFMSQKKILVLLGEKRAAPVVPKDFQETFGLGLFCLTNLLY
jgi:hypothetical protein